MSDYDPDLIEKIQLEVIEIFLKNGVDQNFTAKILWSILVYIYERSAFNEEEIEDIFLSMQDKIRVGRRQSK